MVGPQAGEILQAFIDGLPFDISELPSETCHAFFASWFQRVAGEILDDALPGDDVASVRVGDQEMADAARAAFEASHAGDPPPGLQSADTDMAAAAGHVGPVTASPSGNPYELSFRASAPASGPDAPSLAGQVIDCPMCNGTANPSCVLCHGTLKLTVGA
jgi:hypothetical protein